MRDKRYASKLYDIDPGEVRAEIDALPSADDWPGLDGEELARRLATLEKIKDRIREDGPHVAMPSSERGRQFIPFAALRGYDEMLRQAEEDADSWDGRDRTPDRPPFGHGEGRRDARGT